MSSRHHVPPHRNNSAQAPYSLNFAHHRQRRFFSTFHFILLILITHLTSMLPCGTTCGTQSSVEPTKVGLCFEYSLVTRIRNVFSIITYAYATATPHPLSVSPPNLTICVTIPDKGGPEVFIQMAFAIEYYRGKFPNLNFSGGLQLLAISNHSSATSNDLHSPIDVVNMWIDKSGDALCDVWVGPGASETSRIISPLIERPLWIDAGWDSGSLLGEDDSPANYLSALPVNYRTTRNFNLFTFAAQLGWQQFFVLSAGGDDADSENDMISDLFARSSPLGISLMGHFTLQTQGAETNQNATVEEALVSILQIMKEKSYLSRVVFVVGVDPTSLSTALNNAHLRNHFVFLWDETYCRESDRLSTLSEVSSTWTEVEGSFCCGTSIDPGLAYPYLSKYSEMLLNPSAPFEKAVDALLNNGYSVDEVLAAKSNFTVSSVYATDAFVSASSILQSYFANQEPLKYNYFQNRSTGAYQKPDWTLGEPVPGYVPEDSNEVDVSYNALQFDSYTIAGYARRLDAFRASCMTGDLIVDGSRPFTRFNIYNSATRGQRTLAEEATRKQFLTDTEFNSRQSLFESFVGRDANETVLMMIYPHCINGSNLNYSLCPPAFADNVAMRVAFAYEQWGYTNYPFSDQYDLHRTDTPVTIYILNTKYTLYAPNATGSQTTFLNFDSPIPLDRLPLPIANVNDLIVANDSANIILILLLILSALLIIASATVMLILYRNYTRDLATQHAPTDPRRPVAIVFTDIESSTALWAECPRHMGDAVDLHNEVIRLCISKHNGYEVKTIGDAFMLAFKLASDAVACSVAIQKSLFEADWEHAGDTPKERKERLKLAVKEEEKKKQTGRQMDIEMTKMASKGRLADEANAGGLVVGNDNPAAIINSFYLQQAILKKEEMKTRTAANNNVVNEFANPTDLSSHRPSHAFIASIVHVDIKKQQNDSYRDDKELSDHSANDSGPHRPPGYNSNNSSPNFGPTADECDNSMGSDDLNDAESLYYYNIKRRESLASKDPFGAEAQSQHNGLRVRIGGAHGLVTIKQTMRDIRSGATFELPEGHDARSSKAGLLLGNNNWEERELFTRFNNKRKQATFTTSYDYFGSVVNTAARVESLGHGGQTLFTRELLAAADQEFEEAAALRGERITCTLYGDLSAQIGTSNQAPPKKQIAEAADLNNKHPFPSDHLFSLGIPTNMINNPLSSANRFVSGFNEKQQASRQKRSTTAVPHGIIVHGLRNIDLSMACSQIIPPTNGNGGSGGGTQFTEAATTTISVKTDSLSHTASDVSTSGAKYSYSNHSSGTPLSSPPIIAHHINTSATNTVSTERTSGTDNSTPTPSPVVPPTIGTAFVSAAPKLSLMPALHPMFNSPMLTGHGGAATRNPLEPGNEDKLLRNAQFDKGRVQEVSGEEETTMKAADSTSAGSPTGLPLLLKQSTLTMSLRCSLGIFTYGSLYLRGLTKAVEIIEITSPPVLKRRFPPLRLERDDEKAELAPAIGVRIGGVHPMTERNATPTIKQKKFRNVFINDNPNPAPYTFGLGSASQRLQNIPNEVILSRLDDFIVKRVSEASRQNEMAVRLGLCLIESLFSVLEPSESEELFQLILARWRIVPQRDAPDIYKALAHQRNKMRAQDIQAKPTAPLSNAKAALEAATNNEINTPTSAMSAATERTSSTGASSRSLSDRDSIQVNSTAMPKTTMTQITSYHALQGGNVVRTESTSTAASAFGERELQRRQQLAVAVAAGAPTRQIETVAKALLASKMVPSALLKYDRAAAIANGQRRRKYIFEKE